MSRADFNDGFVLLYRHGNNAMRKRRIQAHHDGQFSPILEFILPLGFQEGKLTKFRCRFLWFLSCLLIVSVCHPRNCRTPKGCWQISRGEQHCGLNLRKIDPTFCHTISRWISCGDEALFHVALRKPFYDGL